MNFFLLITALISLGFVPYRADYGSYHPQKDWDFSLGSAVAKPSLSLEKARMQGINVSLPKTEVMPQNLPQPVKIVVPKARGVLQEIVIYSEEKLGEEIIGRELAKRIIEEIKSLKKEELRSEEVRTKLLLVSKKSLVKRAKEEVKEKKTLKAVREPKEKILLQVPEEEEVDLLVQVIYGKGKIVLKLPPLDPREKERLLRELERLAYIIGRTNELPQIDKVPE